MVVDVSVSYFENSHENYIFMTKTISIFQKSITKSLLFKNLSIFFNMILIIIYRNMNKLKIDKANVQFVFKLSIHLLSREIMTMTIQVVHLIMI